MVAVDAPFDGARFIAERYPECNAERNRRRSAERLIAARREEQERKLKAARRAMKEAERAAKDYRSGSDLI